MNLKIAGQWEHFWSTRIGPLDSQGRVCISLKVDWKPYIKEHGITLQGKAQHVILQIKEEIIGFLNIYAPNRSQSRKELWYLITNNFPVVDACVWEVTST